MRAALSRKGRGQEKRGAALAFTFITNAFG